MSKTIKERAVRFGCIAKEMSSLKEDVCNEEFREFWDNVSLSQPNGVSFHGIPEYVSEVCCQAYITGATKQRAIDYAKACNTFCKFHCGEKKGCMCEDLCIFSTLFTEGEE